MWLERNCTKIHYVHSYKLGSVLTLQCVEFLVTFHQKAELCGSCNEQVQNCHNFKFLSKAAKKGARRFSLYKIQLQTYIISEIEFLFYLIDIFPPTFSVFSRLTPALSQSVDMLLAKMAETTGGFFPHLQNKEILMLRALYRSPQWGSSSAGVRYVVPVK